MAVIRDFTTASGLVAESAYWRFNNWEQLANRQPDGSYSVPAVARFRGYVSGEAFTDGLNFVEGADVVVEFTPAAISGNMVAQAYAALKALPEFEGATDEI